jgi:hypothetical protein
MRDSELTIFYIRPPEQVTSMHLSRRQPESAFHDTAISFKLNHTERNLVYVCQIWKWDRTAICSDWTATCMTVQTACFEPAPLGSPFVMRAHRLPSTGGAFAFTFNSSLLSLIRMGSSRPLPRTVAYSGSNAARPGRASARAPPRLILNMDNATLRLVVAIELEEARSVKDDSNGTSDCAMARRFAIDQLLSCRTLNRIEEMSPTELVRTALPPPTANDTCTCCEDPLKATNAWQTPCEHWYCLDCLETLIRASMADETLYSPRCCEILPWQEIKVLLPKDLATTFEHKKRELDTPAGERLYCAQPACSHFLGNTASRAKFVRCPLCRSNTCATCRAVSHAGPCLFQPNEAEQQTIQLAKEQGWQSCQRCKQIVDLIPGGCNHMTCRCGHQFCYACGLRWKTCHCRILDIADPGNGVEADFVAAQERYTEALRGVEARTRQLREAQLVLVQALRGMLQAIIARWTQ